MARYSAILRDDNTEAPISGAVISVINSATGALATLTDDLSAPMLNPFTTGPLGDITFNTSDNVYRLEYRYNGIERRADDVIVGMPSAFAGPAGPAFATYFTLANFKAASTSNASQILQDPAIAFGQFNWETANAPYTADDINVIKANSTALSVGAWVRQSNANLASKQTGTGAVVVDAQTVSNARDILPVQYSSFQNALNAADTKGVPMLAAGANVTTSTPCDIRGKYFSLTGIPNKSKITATGTPAFLFNGESASEVSYSPFVLSGVDMDGATLLTTAAISVRYRRNYIIENCLISNALVGVKLKDANSGILRNIRTSAVGIGLHSVGSNHQSTHDSCSFNGASDVGIKLDSAGTGTDGNYGLTFMGCLAQDNARGIEVNYGVEADWIGGYLGENTTGYAVDNKGGVLNVNGGVFFFDGAAGNYLVHPVGSGTTGRNGVTRFRGTRIAASGTNGLAKLVNLTAGEVDLTKNGKVTFEDIDLYSLIAGGGLLNGDPIGCIGPNKSLVARNGRNWISGANTGTAPTNFTDVATGNVRKITNTSTSPPSTIGFTTPLSLDYRIDGPMFVILCYQSSKALTIRTGTGAFLGGGVTLATAAATGAYSATGWKTFFAFEVTPTALSAGAAVDIFTNSAVALDYVALLRVGLADADFVNSGGKAGVLSNLYFP